MSLDAIRAALVAVISSVPDMGAVHAWERYDGQTAGLLEHYTVQLAGKRQVRGWFVRRVRSETQRQAGKAFFDRHGWEIRGYMGLEDANQSELVFDGLVEALRTALLADLTLGGVVMPPERRDDNTPELRVETGPVLFAGVLCHGASLQLMTKSFVTVP